MSWVKMPKEAIENSLLMLYDLQTPVERAVNCTLEKNGHGFDAVDAPILTRYAKELQRFGSLPLPALEYVKHKLWKYRKQLLNMGVVSQDMITVAEQLSFDFS